MLSRNGIQIDTADVLTLLNTEYQKQWTARIEQNNRLNRCRLKTLLELVELKKYSIIKNTGHDTAKIRNKTNVVKSVQNIWTIL